MTGFEHPVSTPVHKKDQSSDSRPGQLGCRAPNRLADGEARFQQFPHPFQRNHVGAVAKRLVRAGMGFEKQAGAANELAVKQFEAQLLNTQSLEISTRQQIMETENVLNVLPGRPGQYSLFRTHHTVNLVSEQGTTEH